MKYIMAKPTRLYCQSCDETFVLPQNGTIKLYQELKCPLDDVNIYFLLKIFDTMKKNLNSSHFFPSSNC